MKRKNLILAALLFGGASSVQAAVCNSSMSISPADSTPVTCLASTIDNISSSQASIDAAIAFLEGGNPSNNVIWLGKEESGSQTGSDPINFSGVWSGSFGSWASTGQWENIVVALKFDNVPVEFHLLGDLSPTTSGYWETSTTSPSGTAGCSLADILTSACSAGYAALSNVNYFQASGPDFPGGDPIPLPAAVWLFGSALLGVVGVGYRRKRQA